jgi:hypothetical protein
VAYGDGLVQGRAWHAGTRPVGLAAGRSWAGEGCRPKWPSWVRSRVWAELGLVLGKWLG